MGRRWIPWIGLLGLLAAGCGDDDDADPPSSVETSSSTSAAADGFVVALNARCVELVEPVLAIRAGEDPPDLARHLVEQPQLEPLLEEFDADVAALPVADDEEATAAAWEAYVEMLDAGDVQLATAAATGDPAQYDVAQEAFLATLDASPERAALTEHGIECPAR